MGSDKEVINFIIGSTQWTCWFLRWRKALYFLGILMAVISIGMLYRLVYVYSSYIDLQEEYKVFQNGKVDGTKEHAIYEGMLSHKDNHGIGSVAHILHILDVAQQAHVQIKEWSIREQEIIEVRGKKELDIHTFVTKLSSRSGRGKYDEVVQKESSGQIYIGKITRTMERLSTE